MYTLSKKLKKNSGNKKGSGKLNQKSKTDASYTVRNKDTSSAKKDNTKSQSNKLAGTTTEIDTLKRSIGASFVKSDSVSVINNLNEKDSLNLKCNQNLIIHYPFDVAQLSDIDKKNILKEISRNNVAKITITGYTDSIGGDGIYNKQLSFRRAKIISLYLIDIGVQKNKIRYNGLSSNAPLSDNATEQGRWLNRRTEILIEYKCK